ncbi:MAG: hypothetical protein RMK30_06295 [Anaerolineae bacterium]|nr:hypothetical protein [Anaerolineae bacterium]MDW8102469.1 hypothetical protein [Anaerolineae bacterium]
MARILGGTFIALAGLALFILIVLFAAGTRTQNYESWWISIPTGFPLVWLLLGLAWAVWTRRRIRPVAGILTAFGALWYAVFFAYATFGITRAVIESTSPLAGIAYLALIPIWFIALLSTLLGWALLRGQNIPWVRFVYLSISLAWLVAWLGFWWALFPALERIELTHPMTWIVNGFFLLPTLLTLGLAAWSGKKEKR